MILPADKEYTTVLMDKETYDNKIHMITSEGNYSVIRRDLTKGIERKIREKLWSLVEKKSTWTCTGDYDQSTAHLPTSTGSPKYTNMMSHSGQ